LLQLLPVFLKWEVVDMKAQQVRALTLGGSSRDRRTIETGVNSLAPLSRRGSEAIPHSARPWLALGRRR
jgi:hypothetical protein